MNTALRAQPVPGQAGSKVHRKKRRTQGNGKHGASATRPRQPPRGERPTCRRRAHQKQAQRAAATPRRAIRPGLVAETAGGRQASAAGEGEAVPPEATEGRSARGAKASGVEAGTGRDLGARCAARQPGPAHGPGTQRLSSHLHDNAGEPIRDERRIFRSAHSPLLHPRSNPVSVRKQSMTSHRDDDPDSNDGRPSANGTRRTPVLSNAANARRLSPPKTHEQRTSRTDQRTEINACSATPACRSSLSARSWWSRPTRGLAVGPGDVPGARALLLA